MQLTYKQKWQLGYDDGLAGNERKTNDAVYLRGYAAGKKNRRGIEMEHNHPIKDKFGGTIIMEFGCPLCDEYEAIRVYNWIQSELDSPILYMEGPLQAFVQLVHERCDQER